MVDIDYEFPAKLAAKDTKTAVNEFCQRFCKRPVTKECIVYVTQKYDTGFQSTVRLNCVDGMEFAGEVGATQKDAEKSAGQQVLDFYADQINSMPKLAGPNKKKRPAAAPGADPAAKALRPGDDPMAAVAGAAGMPNPAISAKSELNSTAARILRRPMEKGDVAYETLQVSGGYQSTVTMPKLPNEWASEVWAGEVCLKRQDAEQSAASVALQSLLADPSLAETINAPPKQKGWSPTDKGKGKGKFGFGKDKGKGKDKGMMGKGKGFDPWSAMAAMGMMGWS